MMNKLTISLIIISVITIMIVVSVQKCSNDRHIKESGILTTARVYKSQKKPAKGYCFVYYRYEVNGKIYNNHTKEGLSEIKEENILGSDVPLLYDSKDPAAHVILLTKDDYNGTSLQIPDSLTWFNY
jgi:hypothetical protein